MHEPTKVAISHSRLLALLRNLVHLLPFGFALFEIVLNWNVYYVGTKPYSTAVYQIAAKAHEILIQASITTVSPVPQEDGLIITVLGFPRHVSVVPSPLALKMNTKSKIYYRSYSL